MNGIRLIQIHPAAAASAGIHDGDAITVESPRGAVTGTALLWEGIREDTIFVPNSFGPRQKMAEELRTALLRVRQPSGGRPVFRQPFRPAGLQVLRL